MGRFEEARKKSKFIFRSVNSHGQYVHLKVCYYT